MHLEVVDHEHRGIKTGTKRVLVVPSDERGYFRFRDTLGGQRIVTKLGLADLSPDQITAVEAGETSTTDFFEPAGDDPVTWQPREGVLIVGEMSPGHEFSAYVAVRDVVEFQAVLAQAE